MKTLHEICKSVGVSRRALQHYDDIGLLPPTQRTEGNYRLYDDASVEKLWTILLLQALGYQLRDIKDILNNPTFDIRESIGKHIEEMTKKKEQLENLIGYAKIIKLTGTVPYNFEEFGDITFDEFIMNSQKTWNMNILSGGEDKLFMLQEGIEEQLYSPKKELSSGETDEIVENISDYVDFEKVINMQECVDEFKILTCKDVNSEDVQNHVKNLYDHINGLFDRSISLNGFLLWGKMLVSGGDISVMHTNRLGQETTDFILKAIQTYCDKFTDEQRQMRGGNINEKSN